MRLGRGRCGKPRAFRNCCRHSCGYAAPRQSLRTMGPAVRKAIGFPQRQRLSREELFEFHLVICLSSDKQGSSGVRAFRNSRYKHCTPPRSEPKPETAITRKFRPHVHLHAEPGIQQSFELDLQAMVHRTEPEARSSSFCDQLIPS